MNRRMMVGMALAMACVGTQAATPLGERIKADFGAEALAAPFVHYDVPAMSGEQRLPDAYPCDGTSGGTVGIVLAKDEYEPGSFLIYPNRDLGKVRLELGEFKNETGVVFPKENLDLKVIKVWYQNRNAWFSYFGDSGFKLVPELLLNDEELIRVDTKTTSNYARIREADGSVREQWINPPRQLFVSYWDSYRRAESFSCMKPGFADADTLQPVTLEKGAFKQFFLTAHATKDTPAGLYKGAVKVICESRSLESKSKNGDSSSTLRFGLQTSTIPVSIRVLDFVLPKPMCYFDEHRRFDVSFYAYERLGLVMARNGGDLKLAEKQLEAVWRDHVEHGHDVIMHSDLYIDGQGADHLRIMKKAGCRTDVFLGNVPVASRGGTETEWDSFNRRSAAEMRRVLGDARVYAGFGDEPPAWWLQMHRPVMRSAQKAGILFYLAGSDNVFRKSGYVFDWHNIAKTAENDTSTELWNRLGNTQNVAWYANQHVGTEDPDLNRRQNGMAAYLSNYSALCNYAHHFDSWNDDREGYKPMVFTYGQGKGVIDTLQWEGFREGLDDIRYATLLVTMARKIAAETKDVDARYTARRALQYLASFRKDADDLNACRMEMIGHILKLKKILGE